MPDFFQRCIFSDIEEIFISLTFPRTCSNHEPCFWYKTIGGISSHWPQVFPVLFPVCRTQEHMKHLLQSQSNKTSSVFKSNMHQGNPKWWTKFKKKICKIRRFGVISLWYPLCFILFVSKIKTRFTTLDPYAVITELFHSLVCQILLALRQKCKSFYLNKHCIGKAAHSQHLLFFKYCCK